MQTQKKIKISTVLYFHCIGSDFTNNYYEYQIPTKLSQANLIVPGKESEEIWPVANEDGTLHCQSR